VWGKLTVHFKLDTNGAPSWKPLPFLFTVPYSLLGHYALWLWMVTAVAISLSGPIFAWRIAFRLVGAEPARRYAAYAAGLFAAVVLLLMEDPIAPANYWHYILSAESDTMIVALCLAAVDCHLNGRHRWAFAVWWLGALGRPEVWPFCGLAGLWLWRTMPSFRRWLLAALGVLLLLWFAIPGLTSKSAFTAGNIAQNSPRAVHGNKVTGTIKRFFELEGATVWVLAGLSVALAAYRRQRTILLLAAGTLLWLLIEIAFAVKGFPAVPRYMFEAGAGVVVLAAVLVGRVILELPPLVGGLLSRRASPRFGASLAGQLGTWATVLVLVVIGLSMVGPAHRQYRLEHKDFLHERLRTREIGRLQKVVSLLGGSRILGCGQPNIPIGYQSVFAWYLGIKVGILYVNPKFLKLHPHTLVNIYPLSNGWRVFPSHVTAATEPHCHGLRLTYRS
jgi:hypothetical protein